MIRQLKGTRNFISDNSESVSVEYYVTKNENDYELEESCTLYGVELVKLVSGNITETSTCSGITDQKMQINTIVDKLIGLCVTPTTLDYAVDEMISSFSA